MDFKVKYTQSAMPFKQMENIATFLSALSKVPNFRSFDLFSTVDLFEAKNIPQVIRCILACKRFAEIEAKSKGIENLNNNNFNSPKENHSKDNTEGLNEKIEGINLSKDEPEIQGESEIEIEKESFDSEIENGSFENIQQEELEEENEESKTIKTDEIVEEMIQPEVELVENDLQSTEAEEYETFTTENPGTFEIQVSN